MDDGFLNLTPEHKQQKKKIDELDLIKIKKIPASKNTIKKVKKKKSTEWKKIFANYIFAKYLISRM